LLLSRLCCCRHQSCSMSHLHGFLLHLTGGCCWKGLGWIWATPKSCWT
jgi:hypothetical protein